jgi:hypothetical protein
MFFGIERRWVHWAVLFALLGMCGCVRRRLTVRSNPPGALVYVDRQLIGATPVSHSFVYYATRHFEIVKDGYRTETFLRTFHPPWYEWPPLDFISENLWPFEKRDERIVDVEMIADPGVPTDALVASAEGLRLQASQGMAVMTPGGSAGTTGTGPYTDPTLPLVRPDVPLSTSVPELSSPLPAPPPGFYPSGPIAPPIPGQAIPPVNLGPPGPSLRDWFQPPASLPSTSVTPGGSYRPPSQP